MRYDELGHGARREFNLLWHFLRQVKAAAARNPFRAFSSLRFYPRWRRNVRPGFDWLRAGEPWMPFPCLDLLAKIARPGMSVFEWGSGGSSVFWVRRGLVGYSIEHNEGWARRVRERLAAEANARWEVLWVPPDPLPAGAKRTDPADPDGCSSSVLDRVEFRTYVRAIDPFPDGSFDIVLVDGRARPACLLRALPKVKPGGYLILDDSQRPHYRPAADRVPWPRREVVGPKSQDPWFSCTTVWRRPPETA